jgi:hypothetical protein
MTRQVALPRRRWRLLAVGGSLPVVFVLLDVALAAAVAAFGIDVSVQAAERRYRIAHADFHHGLAPGFSGNGHWGPRRYPIVTNSLGFRDATPRTVSPQASGRRVLFIGDSFTEGIGVAWDDTFVGRLQRQLAAGGVEVLNAAAVSYAPILYRRKVEHLVEDVGLQFERLVVCIDVSDPYDEMERYVTDVDGNVADRQSGGPEDALKRFIQDHTLMLNVVSAGIRAWRHGSSSPFGRPQSAWTADPGLFERVGRPGLERATEHMDALRALLCARGTAMTVVVYPWPDQIARRERDCVHVAHWRDWAAAHGVDFVDAFPAFLDAGEAAQVIERCFIPGDVHWNEQGHARMAEVLGSHLR